jgi:hypothetical protein
MTHIELKEYFEQQRTMGLKTRHIEQNEKQIKQHLASVRAAKISKQVFWEKNQYIGHNPKITPEQIIAKTSTDKFPCDATTVRFHSLKHKVATAYFYGKSETRKFGNNHTWTYPASKLTVTFPNTNPSNGRRAWGYAYQGDLHNSMSRQEVDISLDYIEDVLSDFLNL